MKNVLIALTLTVSLLAGSLAVSQDRKLTMGAGGPPAAAGNCGITDATAYWNLDEASGTRLDQLNGCGGSGCDLTDNNTVTQATGKVGSAASFASASSEFLSRADDATLSMGDIDYSFTAWVYLDSLGATQAIVGKDNGTSEYLLYITASNLGDYENADVNFVIANTFGALTTGTWYFLFAYHDAVGNQIGISVNDGTIDTASTTVPGVDGTDEFRIGARSAGTPLYLNGRIDEVLLIKRKLPATEVTCIYNSGAGRTMSGGVL